LKYEEKVLQEIIKETGGEDLPKTNKIYQNVDNNRRGEWFRCGASGRSMRGTGTHAALMISYDSLDEAKRVEEILMPIKQKYIDQFQTNDFSDWISSYDFSWHADIEGSIFNEPTKEDIEKAIEMLMDGIKSSLEVRIYNVIQSSPTHSILGPVYGNYHHLLKKIKKCLDPKNISNPPNPIPID